MKNIIAIDFEFIEDGRTIEPISVGLARIDGRKYYAVFEEFNPSKASPWVKENVIAKLPPRITSDYDSPRIREESLAWKSTERIRLDILSFVGKETPEFWGNYCAHDFVLLGRVMGTREQPDWISRAVDWLGGKRHPKAFNPMVESYPDGWPYFINDIQAFRVYLGKPDKILPPQVENHISIEDAAWVLEAREFLIGG